MTPHPRLFTIKGKRHLDFGARPTDFTIAGSAAHPVHGFANETFSTLRYCEQVTFNPGATTASSNTFSATGLYDPNITGTGHQPYGFDELCTTGGPYNRYSVLRTRLRYVAFVPELQSSTPGTIQPLAACMISLNLRRENTANFPTLYTNVEDVSNVSSSIASQFYRTDMRTEWVDVPRYLGVSRKTFLSSTEYSGTYAANPETQLYWILTIGTTSQAVLDPIDIYVTVMIDYEAKFWSYNTSVASISEVVKRLEKLEEEEKVPYTVRVKAGSPPKGCDNIKNQKKGSG
jgi:hypothetical protein